MCERKLHLEGNKHKKMRITVKKPSIQSDDRARENTKHCMAKPEGKNGGN